MLDNIQSSGHGSSPSFVKDLSVIVVIPSVELSRYSFVVDEAMVEVSVPSVELLRYS